MAQNTNPKAKSRSANALPCTYTATLFRVIFGSALLLLGTLLLLACMMENQPGFNPFARFAWGLFGVLTFPFILLILWAGTLCVVSAYHAVSWRGFVLLFFTVLFFAAFVDLTSQIAGAPLVRYHLDRVNPMRQDMSQYLPMLGKAYEISSGGAGTGLFGMIIACPFYLIFSVWGAVLCVIAMVVFLLMFFRTNPVQLIGVISDMLERHRVKRSQNPKPQKPEKAKKAEPKPKAPQPVRVPARGASSAYTAGIAATPVISSRGAYEPAAYTDPVTADVPQAAPAVDQAPIPDDDDWGNEFPPTVSGDYQQISFPTDDVYPLEDEDPYPPQTLQPEPAPAPAPAPARTEKHLFSRRSRHNPAPAVSGQGYNTVSPVEEEPAPAAPAAAAVPAYHTARAPQPVQETPRMPDPVPVQSSAPQPAAPQPAPVYHPEPAPAPVKETPVSAPAERIPAHEKPVERIPDLVRTPAVPLSETPAAVEISGTDEEDDLDPGIITRENWELHTHQHETEPQKKRVSTTRMAMDDKPKLVGVDPVSDVIGVKHAIPSRDTMRTGDPEKRGMDGHEHMQTGVQMSMSFPYQYVPPSVDLLSVPRKNLTDNTAEDMERGATITNTLSAFRINSEIRQVTHGPAITRFAIQIAAGVKVSAVTSVTENIALELGIKQVRIEAPIQGTNYIGIEVPNRVATPVTFREVLECEALANARSNPLLVALGKDIGGTPILCDLGKMPHLLIAGSTGSGKSVCINSIICSLIYRASPKQVRLILVDPKQVELQVYNSIPHLLVPVISDPKKSAAVLNWVVNEMFERYSKFTAAKVRNLAGFNKIKAGTDEELPNIVVIIDEMADIMEVCRKDVEESIRRLAALARAAGIYMIVATQRPSVDVITGVIKNNIPSRIAFSVTSTADSRTIIDVGGAEKLLGKGDMLYKPTGSTPVRVQGCFLSDEEVNDICNDLAGRYETNYNPDIQETINEVRDEPEADTVTGTGDEVHGGDSTDFDDLLHDAILMAIEDGQTSVSMLQRRLRVGYGRAGRLVDEMEKRGIISKSEGSKPRKTLMTREDYARLLESQQD